MLFHSVKCSVAGLFIGLTTLSHAQVSLTSTSYVQNFDSLSATGLANVWSNNTTLSGWYAFRELPIPGTFAAASYRSDLGAVQGLYSFGAQSGGNMSDRSLGSIAGNNTANGGNFYFGLGFTNALLATITDLAISYSQETWRVGSAGLGDIVNFQFSLNASGINDHAATWQNLDSLDMAPTITAPTGNADGNAVTMSRSGTLSNLAVSNGATIWLRWADVDNLSGADYGLGVDDLSINFTTASGGGGDITTTPEPFTMALTGLGAAAVLRRKLKAKQKPATS